MLSDKQFDCYNITGTKKNKIKMIKKLKEIKLKNGGGKIFVGSVPPGQEDMFDEWNPKE